MLSNIALCPGPTTQNSGKGSGIVLVASSEQEDDKGGRDFISDYKPKKGLMFEISSEDGFQIRCESIEGMKGRHMLILLPIPCILPQFLLLLLFFVMQHGTRL